MRVFSLLFVCLISASTVLSEADWTCEECSEGGPALGDWLASEDNLMYETDVLLAELCPRHPEPQYCQDNLPRFWKEVGPVIMREHYSHVCDDLECRRQQRTSVPSCEACTARINRTADFLAAEETIVAWTSTLMEWCANNSDVVQECEEAVQWGVPLALPALSQADRGWVQGFCIVWTACSP